eukprot:jgi/Hompol1/5794/HPOL_004701-RA
MFFNAFMMQMQLQAAGLSQPGMFAGAPFNPMAAALMNPAMLVAMGMGLNQVPAATTSAAAPYNTAHAYNPYANTSSTDFFRPIPPPLPFSTRRSSLSAKSGLLGGTRHQSAHDIYNLNREKSVLDIIFEFRENPGVRWVIPKNAIFETADTHAPYRYIFTNICHFTIGVVESQST